MCSGRKWEYVGMYYGSFSYHLDEKGRLLLNKKFRAQLGDKVYILKGYDGALSLYDETSFDAYMKAMQELPILNSKDARDVYRIALSSVYDLAIDKVGRIVIPASLLSRYNISRDVMVIGLIDHFEIWDKDKWESYLSDNEKDYEIKSEKLLIKNEQ